jgi:hypothetical protein
MRAAIEQDFRTCLTADGRSMPTPEGHIIIMGEGAKAGRYLPHRSSGRWAGGSITKGAAIGCRTLLNRMSDLGVARQLIDARLPTRRPCLESPQAASPASGLLGSPRPTGAVSSAWRGI